MNGTSIRNSSTIAIIDMGTNTFNLLVADVSPDKKFKILFENKLPVKLGEGGLSNNEIKPEAWKRGINAIEKHVSDAKRFNPQQIYAFATSATRDARNGKEFVADIKKHCGITVEIITGQHEAELIYLGVKQAINLGNTYNLILDIGGGSNEFIIANNDKIVWLQSFNLGVSRLMQKFTTSDPIQVEEIQTLEEYFTVQLAPLFDAVQKFKPTTLIGCSGTFDSFRNILEHRNIVKLTQDPWSEIPLDVFRELHSELIRTTLEERLQIKGLVSIRAEFIVVATVFVNFILKKLSITQMLQSSYSLKEGAFAKLAN
ncbi:MAG: exopolyphosphatase [Bacteroidales bacterium]|nr:exopolyphosphatase [Bacteroidales bacterium]HPD94967.1 hypothetical protein [Tenuifilaceae bacterium]